ncbi:MAG: VCBS repeat-containing protein [Hyphomicrobium aestuarii]|nr:VCBS repeat-containing protein [Hyphomicrobium aestuarii]
MYGFIKEPIPLPDRFGAPLRLLSIEATAPIELSSYTPTAAFRGNQAAIAGGALSTPAARTGAILVREANCSLTQYGIGNVAGTASTITAVLPNADAYLHRLSGITAPAGTFPRGCADRTKGLPSAGGVYLGQAGNGDILSAISDTRGKVTLLRFTTAGIPVSQTVLVASDAAGTLAAADLNADGIGDLVTPYVSAAGITGIGVFLSRADGSVNPVAIYGGYPSTVDRFSPTVSIEDVNGDGNLDIVAVGGSFGGPSPTVVTLTGVGNGTFAPASASIKAIRTGPFVLADFNGDRQVDLLTAGGLLMQGNGGGSFGAPVQRLNVTERQARNLAIGDFDGDGKLDVALRDGNIITTLMGGGDGSFVAKGSYAAIRGANYLSVNDLNGDGNADIVVGLTGPKVYGPNLNSNSVTQFLFGRGDGSFAAAAQVIPDVGISLSENAPTFALTDFNEDGFPDLIARSPGNPTRLAILAGSASATFDTEAPLASLSFRPDLVSSGDVNSDGKPDLIAAGPRLAVLRGMGNGVFTAEQSYPLPGTGDPLHLQNLAVADFNGDGRVDVIVVMGRQSAAVGGAFVFIADADGTLKPPVQIDGATNLKALAVGDLDADGRADIAVGGLDPQFYSSGNVLRGVRVYRGNADGSFSSALALNPGFIHVALAIGDMTKDGKRDLVVASQDNSLNDTVFVLPGLGNGSFGAASSFPLPGGGPGIVSLAIGDLTFDGNADVMFAGGSYTGVLIGNGNGAVSGPSVLTIAGGATYVVAADLNKDTVMDAVVLMAGQGLVPLVRVAAVTTAAVPPVAADFTVAVTPSSGTVATGQSVQTTLNLAFEGGFNQIVTFSCANLPANARCSFSPASVTPTAGAGSTTVTISTGTTVASVVGPTVTSVGGDWAASASLGFIGVGSLGLAAAAKRRRRQWQGKLRTMFLCAMMAFGLVAGCGGGAAGGAGGGTADGTGGGTAGGAGGAGAVVTPSGSSGVGITASGGGVSKTIMYSLTVQ